MTDETWVLVSNRAPHYDFLAHRGVVEAAGGSLVPVDLADPTARRAALARATVGVVVNDRFGHEDFAQAPKLRALVSASVGFDQIDLAAATRHGVMVANTPDLCTEEVADHTLMLLLACYRRLPQAIAQQRRGRISWSDIALHSGPWPSLRGSIAGLIGFGHIARLVAARFLAVGLQVIACDPFVTSDVARNLGVELTRFEDLLARADYVSVHTPLTPTTRHLLNAAAFARMKPTAKVINTARGAVIDEAAIIEALRQGRIAGAGLDVLEHEPLATDNPLLAMDNVILTPHTAGWSDHARAWGAESAMRDAALVLQGGRPRGLQNRDVRAKG